MKSFKISPFPEVERSPADWFWIYGCAEREAFRHQELIRAKNDARLKVGYPGEFMTPHQTVHFRTMLPAGRFPVFCVGAPHIAEIGADQPGMFEITLTVAELEQDVPCLGCAENFHWETSIDGIEWHYTAAIPGGEVPPHRAEFPRMKLVPERSPEGVYDFGREFFGWICIANAPATKLYVGESVPEALNRDPEDFEQRLDLVKLADGTLRSAVPLALRYLTLDDGGGAEVFAEAVYTPLKLAKRFVSGDAELDKIWETGVYTLHLCTYHFLLDGVKRDRLPWAGDLAVSLLSMIHSYCEAAPIRDTLAILGSAGIRNCHINGITDYTLWYLICFEMYMDYFKDEDFLRQEYFRIVETADLLLAQRLANGLLPVCGWVLIDWADGDKNCALQVLFYRALEALSKLANRMDDKDNSQKWAELAGELKTHIRRDFYDPASGLFRCSPGSDEFLRHQNFLAAGSVATEAESRRIVEKLIANKLPAVGTPYMKSFEILSYIQAGFKTEAVEEIRRFWGGMVQAGATTFFEAYGEGKNGSGLYDFYSRPYGLSLCHAWGSAPAFLLPMCFEK